MKKPKISVIGLGFVGLTVAVVNAKKGFDTVGIDINSRKINELRKGISDFYEPQLVPYLKESISNRKISFTTDLKEMLNTDISFITVGTPSRKDGKIDLSFVKNAVVDIAKVLKKKKKKHLIVIKSTVIPTTTSSVINPKFKNLKNVSVVVNPEFLRESRAVNDLLKPHLIVIGKNDTKGGLELKKYYNLFYNKSPEILLTDFTTAEMIKYCNNAFLATKISFINSIANICQNIPGTDVKTIAYAIGKDPRIGSLFLNAGPGFGGSCLPKDLSALIEFSNGLDDANILLKSVMTINQIQHKRIIEIMKKMNVFKKEQTVSVLGVAFKKDTNDIRASVAIPFVKILLKKGIKVKIHDPMALKNFKKLFHNKVKYCKTIDDCLSRSHCCVILTGWDKYKKLKPENFKEKMANPNIIDAQRILVPRQFKKLSFRAIGLGS